jgi:hypothetical protein
MGLGASIAVGMIGSQMNESKESLLKSHNIEDDLDDYAYCKLNGDFNRTIDINFSKNDKLITVKNKIIYVLSKIQTPNRTIDNKDNEIDITSKGNFNIGNFISSVNKILFRFLKRLWKPNLHKVEHKMKI